MHTKYRYYILKQHLYASYTYSHRELMQLSVHVLEQNSNTTWTLIKTKSKKWLVSTVFCHVDEFIQTHDLKITKSIKLKP